MCQHSSSLTAGPVIRTDLARENRRYVRWLLNEKQPEFAAVLESAGQELSCPVCQGAVAGHRRRRHPTVHMSGAGV
jgi:hypothetical protein